ncbi:MAG: hypothetical protein ACEQR8_00175 [Cypionkella sp.]
MKTMFLPLLLAIAAPVAAQAAEPAVTLEGEVKLERKRTVDGVEQVELVEPAVVVPGDRLVFTTRYRNPGPAAAENFTVTNAVPAAVALADDNAAGGTVSIDGGKTWGRLAALSVAQPDGTSRPAQPSDVTHLRWIIAAIAPGALGALQYRAVVR